MSSVLILSNYFDVHAFAVAWAVEKLGHSATTWVAPDFPSGQQNSISHSNLKGSEWKIGAKNPINSQDGFDAVWQRRIPYILPLSKDLHEADVELAQRESRHYFKGFLNMMCADAFWVNPVKAREKAQYKICQTEAAIKTGLKIPATLYSNDAQEIRQFFDENAGGIVYKSFLPIGWTQPDEKRIRLWTTKIEDRSLLNDDVELGTCPGIYQECIAKAYELRIVIMGRTCVAAKINSQDDPNLEIDWRKSTDAADVLGWDWVKIPKEIEEKCFNFMDEMGIVFGCLDFVVTPEGEYIFLEVNEQGQFLFVEQYNPEIPLLHMFSEFLISGDKHFKWHRPTSGTFSYMDYVQTDECRYFMKELEKEHVQYRPMILAAEN
ncbi:MAG: hypothetical protein JKY60_11160 [Kordiimonadaceae bacterium]|nr:hypothetical protein [Kordiimonadaceae bacterium]